VITLPQAHALPQWARCQCLTCRGWSSRAPKLCRGVFGARCKSKSNTNKIRKRDLLLSTEILVSSSEAVMKRAFVGGGGAGRRVSLGRS
jgi:hypothetical protein